MPGVDINWAAVLVAALINMGVGSLWYSKALFAKQWVKLTGKKDMEGGGVGYAVAMAGALLQAWIMAHFVAYASSTTFTDGVVTGFWLWLGFVAVTTATNIVFEGRSWKLWQINAGYFLVVLIINGGLLAAWR
jgi:hypothetical protein